MKRIIDNLFIGNQKDCDKNKHSDYYIVHACYETCFSLKTQGHVNKSIKTFRERNLDSHFIYQKKNIYLNMIDGWDSDFSQVYFKAALEFIDKNIKNHQILVHCKEGKSRSPVIVLLYLVKLGIINSSNRDIAKEEFKNKFYPKLDLTDGIDIYLRKNWNFLKKLDSKGFLGELK